MIYFVELAALEIKDHFPSFYHKDGTYFEIIKGEQPIGFISIRPFNEEIKSCNFGVHLVDKYKLTKNIILSAFDLPKKLGYKVMFLASDVKIVTSFLDYMEKFGINYLCTILQKRYYFKRIEV
jgi:hypothetical protein